MSNDLISRKAFKQEVTAMAIKNNFELKKAKELLKIIDDQPTAYDVDKVVEQLIEAQCDTEEDFNSGLMTAVVIVEQGGNL